MGVLYIIKFLWLSLIFTTSSSLFGVIGGICLLFVFLFYLCENSSHPFTLSSGLCRAQNLHYHGESHLDFCFIKKVS